MMARRVLGVVAAAFAWAVMLTGTANAAVWQLVGSASPNGYKNFLLSVAHVPGTNQLWSVGYTLDNAGPDHSLIEHSNGAAFAVSAIPRPGLFEQLNGVAAVSPAHAWAVGGTFVHGSLPLIFTWDGAAWQRTPPPLPAGADGGTLISVRAFSATDVTAVGTWFSSTAEGGPLIEHWNGHVWSASAGTDPTGCQATFTSLAAVPGSPKRFAVGFCLNADGTSTQAVIEQSSGGAWSSAAANAPAQSLLQSITPVSGSDVWAVGSTTAMTGESRTLAEHWDGTSWSVVPTPNPSGNDWLQSIIRVPGTTTLWAVGSAITPTGVIGITERWTGSAWQAIAPVRPSGESNLEGVAAAPGGVWAVGELYPASAGSGPSTLTLAERAGG
jgi:hypothetical protein